MQELPQNRYRRINLKCNTTGYYGCDLLSVSWGLEWRKTKCVGCSGFCGESLPNVSIFPNAIDKSLHIGQWALSIPFLLWFISFFNKMCCYCGRLLNNVTLEINPLWRCYLLSTLEGCHVGLGGHLKGFNFQLFRPKFTIILCQLFNYHQLDSHNYNFPQFIYPFKLQSTDFTHSVVGGLVGL